MPPPKRSRRRRVLRERSFLVTVPVRVHVVAPLSKDEAVRVAAGYVGEALRKHPLPRELHSFLLLDPRGEPIRKSGAVKK